MLWLVIGYLFLFIFRPYEYWGFLGTYHVERLYMIFLLFAVFLSKEKRFISSPINLMVLAFFCVIVVSTIFAFKQADAVKFAFDYFKLIVFYFIIILTVRDEKDLKWFMIAYIAIMFLYVGKSSWEFFVHDRHFYRMEIKRLVGIDASYADPNSFAASIVYSLPFLWALIKCRLESRVVRLLLLAYGLLAVVAIIFTGSRSGMVTGFLFLILVWLWGSKKFIGIIVLTVALLTTWQLMPESYQTRFMSSFFEGVGPASADVSAKGRIEGLKAGVRIIKDYPLLGIGPGNFKYGWGTVEVAGSSHNLYGQLMGELGGMGVLAFLILIATMFKTHISVYKKAKLLQDRAGRENTRPNDLLFLGLNSAAAVQVLILLLFNGNFGHNLYRYNYLWIGAMAVLSIYFVNMKQKSEIRVPQSRFYKRNLFKVPAEKKNDADRDRSVKT